MNRFAMALWSGLLVWVCVWSASSPAAPRAETGGDFPTSGHHRIHVLSPDECKQDYPSLPAPWKPVNGLYGTALDPESQSLYKPSGPWAPEGTAEILEPRGCTPEDLEKQILSSRGSIRGQRDALAKFFGKCSETLKANGSRTALADLFFTTYEICDNPRIRKVIMRLSTGDLVRGFLGIKPGRSRPMVIGKSGVFSNPGDTSQRFMLMHLFDESPFHVLMLASTTGADFVTDNRVAQIGGLTEAQQILGAAELLMQSSLAAKISSVHSVSVSLGAQGALMAGYANKMNPGSNGKRLLTSVLAISPVVDLKAAIDGVFKDNKIAVIGRALFDDAKSTVLGRDMSLKDLFPEDAIESRDIPDFMAVKAVEHLQRRGSSLLYPFSKLDLRTPDDLWSASNFLKIAETEMISTPTLAFASADDPIVKAETNTTSLEKIVKRINSTDSKRRVNNKVAAFTVPAGNHCAFNQVYGWRIFSSFLRSYVVSRSQDLLNRRRPMRVSLPAGLYAEGSFRLERNEAYYMPRFEFKAGLNKISVRQQIFTRVDKKCTGLPMTKAQAHCLRHVDFQVPIAALAQRPLWVKTPKTEAEAESLTRWANVNLRVVDFGTSVIDGSTRVAGGLAWTSYE